MIKKNSFTLFEVLISLIIFAIVLLSIQKLSIYNNSIAIYYELQNLDNQFIETKTIQNSKNIKFQQH